ncbi:MAG: c-type cytochrome biogenesis protein CcmI [Rhodoferax sp.]
MSDDLASLIAPLQRQLAELKDRHAAGAIGKAEWDRETAVLERRLLDLVSSAAAKGSAQPAGRKASGRLLVALALGIVLFAAAGYWLTALPALEAQMAAESQSAGQPSSAQIVAMVDKLAERLKKDPSDGEGWAMLARSYSVMERNDEALEAYARALALRKDDPAVLVDYADALGVKNKHRLAGEPMALINRALAIDPSNIKGLALAGTDAFVRQDFAQAVKYWSEVERVGPADNALVQSVVASLPEARSRAGLPAAPEAAQTTAAPVAPAETVAPVAKAGAQASVGGTVSVSSALLSRTSPQDTVFIFARPANGVRMPLAAMRIQVKDLPYRFTLDDSKSMSPSMPLSSSAQVMVAARISKSGDAIAQPGDLTGQVGPVAMGTQGIALEIKAAREP